MLCQNLFESCPDIWSDSFRLPYVFDCTDRYYQCGTQCLVFYLIRLFFPAIDPRLTNQGWQLVDVPCVNFTAINNKSQTVWLTKYSAVVPDTEPFGVEVL